MVKVFSVSSTSALDLTLLFFTKENPRGSEVFYVCELKHIRKDLCIDIDLKAFTRLQKRHTFTHHTERNLTIPSAVSAVRYSLNSLYYLNETCCFFCCA